MTNLNSIINGKHVVTLKKSKNVLQNNENITEKPKIPGRPNKCSLYINERKDVLDRLLKILNVTKDCNIFYIDDLKDDLDRQKQILDLEEDVKHYFRCGAWGYFTKPNISQPYLSFAKSILKDMNISFSAVYFKDPSNKTTKKKALQLIFPNQ